MDKPRILMVGPGRMVMGGISTVVNSYYELGLPEKVYLKYIPSMKDGMKCKKIFIAVIAYIKFCLQLGKCDIVHVHMAAQASFSRKAIFIRRAHKKEKKIIIHQHAADFDEYYFNNANKVKKQKIRKIFALADRVIVLSDEWAEFFGKNICDKEKIVILYNGVEMPVYNKTNYSDHNVLFLGRLGKRKGSYDLIKAIPDVLEKVPDAMFYLGGDGDVSESKAIVLNNNLADHVKFLGWIRGEKKEYYLKQCSIFTLPSYHEGMPMSVLEAMSYGLATISTNVGGIPQIIEDGVNGIRIEAGDVEALSSRLIFLLQNEEYKRKLGAKAAEQIAAKFDAKNNIEIIFRLYEEILKR